MVVRERRNYFLLMYQNRDWKIHPHFAAAKCRMFTENTGTSRGEQLYLRIELFVKGKIGWELADELQQS
jgi:hypothetical protein